MTVLERFIKYAKVYTTSDPNSESVPSSSRQFDLANILVDELRELGIEAEVDDKCYVYSRLKANTDREIMPIGFIAHMDTAPDMTGENVRPRIIENYDGKDIALNDDVIMRTEDFPALEGLLGKTLVVTDGTTLLGSDDKSGVAEIMAAIDYLIKHPEIEHGDIAIAFTPDEEIGRGADYFDVERFGAKYAYTMDGGRLGELEYESFNANNATVKFYGRNIHPGSAKNKMINAVEMAMEFNSLLPENEKPQYTEGYEGFFHLISCEGSVEEASLFYIIRDHDRACFENRKKLFLSAGEYIKAKYGESAIEIDSKDSYYNMGEVIKNHMEVVEVVKDVMLEQGIEPDVKAIRGGTDGSRLSYMGLPCPNIFTGGDNFHGKYEYLCVEDMERAVKLIVGIVEKYAKM